MEPAPGYLERASKMHNRYLLLGIWWTIPGSLKQQLLAHSDSITMSNPFFDHPILNSPYERPARHWELDASGQPTQKTMAASLEKLEMVGRHFKFNDKPLPLRMQSP